MEALYKLQLLSDSGAVGWCSVTAAMVMEIWVVWQGGGFNDMKVEMIMTKILGSCFCFTWTEPTLPLKNAASQVIGFFRTAILSGCFF